jgi:hypothetical protein
VEVDNKGCRRKRCRSTCLSDELLDHVSGFLHSGDVFSALLVKRDVELLLK